MSCTYLHHTENRPNICGFCHLLGHTYPTHFIDPICRLAPTMSGHTYIAHIIDPILMPALSSSPSGHASLAVIVISFKYLKGVR